MTMTQRRRHAIKELWVLPARQKRRHPQHQDLADLAEFVARCSDLSGFDVAVIGSILEPSETPNDIDIVLRSQHGPSNRSPMNLERVERALVALRLFGISHRYRLDPGFRDVSEEQLTELLTHGRPQAVWKLDSPKWVQARSVGDPSIRTVGTCLVTVTRRLTETDYFEKLPVADGNRYLRPAQPLTSFVS